MALVVPWAGLDGGHDLFAQIVVIELVPSVLVVLLVAGVFAPDVFFFIVRPSPNQACELQL